MKKRWSKVLGVLCYTMGIFCALYVGGWLMLISPINTLITEFSSGELSLTVLIISIVKIALSATFGGFVWCIGYIGYNFFKGTEDPDWDALEKKWKEKRLKEKTKNDNSDIKEGQEGE